MGMPSSHAGLTMFAHDFAKVKMFPDPMCYYLDKYTESRTSCNKTLDIRAYFSTYSK